ncbi:hypothetical protein CLOM_g11217 [Closterium sp. NIES-68]|nr:hypothetical protein CLOM_g11217 [Closterium sp. NIES-68]GJP78429.1 hypothetical protein CLOP_g8727 [Closterium sp. NIES-67]
MSDVPPDMVRAEIQATLQSFATALHANKTTDAAAIFAPEVWLLPPGKQPTNLSDPDSQVAFLGSLKAAGARIALTISDMLLARSARPASSPAENSDASNAATSLVYVVISPKGKVVTVGKAIVVWAAGSKEVADVESDDAAAGVEGKKKKGGKWKLTWAMWNDDIAKSDKEFDAPLSRFLSAGASASAETPLNCARRSAEVRSAAGAAGAVMGGGRAAVVRQLQQQAEDLSEAVASGDCATIQGALSPEITLLPPHEPPRTITRLEAMKQLFQGLVYEGLTLNLTVDDAIPFRLLNPSLAAAPPALDEDSREMLGSDAGRVALSRGTFLLSNVSNGDILAHGTLMLLWTPVFDPSVSAAALPRDPPARFAVQWIMWSATPGKPPAPPAPPSLHSPAPEDRAEAQNTAVLPEGAITGAASSAALRPAETPLRDPSPEEVRPFVLRKVRDFLSALAINDSAAAATVFAPTAVVLEPGSPGQVLETDNAKRAFAQRIANKRLDIEPTLTELVVGSTEDPSSLERAFNEAAAESGFELESGARNNDVLLLLTRFDFTASKASGGAAHTGKAVAVWVGVGKLPFEADSVEATEGLQSDPVNWKLSWLIWNCDPAPTPAYGEVSAVSATSAALIFSSEGVPPAVRDPKPGPVREQLQARLTALAAALALGDAETAEDVLAEGPVLALPAGGRETLAVTAEEKRALLQSLVAPDTLLSLPISAVRLADFAFPKPKPAHPNEDLLYALSWGDYSASANGSEAASGSLFLLWKREQRKASNGSAEVGSKDQWVYGIAWAAWTCTKPKTLHALAAAAAAAAADVAAASVPTSPSPVPLSVPHPEDVRVEFASLLPRLSAAISLAQDNASSLLPLVAPCLTLLPPHSALRPAVCGDERVGAFEAWADTIVQLNPVDVQVVETVPGKKVGDGWGVVESEGGEGWVEDEVVVGGGGRVVGDPKGHLAVLVRVSYVILSADGSQLLDAGKGIQVWEQQQQQQGNSVERGGGGGGVWALTTFAWNSDVASAALTHSAGAAAGAGVETPLESAVNGGGEAKQLQAALAVAAAAVGSGNASAVLRLLAPSGAAVLPPHRPLLWIDAGSLDQAQAALEPLASLSCAPNTSFDSIALLRSLDASLSGTAAVSPLASHHHQALALTTGNFSCTPTPKNSSLAAKAHYGSFVALWEQSAGKAANTAAAASSLHSDKRPWLVKWVLWSNTAAPPAPAPAPAAAVSATMLETLLATS